VVLGGQHGGAGADSTVATFHGCARRQRIHVDARFDAIIVVLVIVVGGDHPAAVMLARYQARRTVWEQDIRESEQAAELSRRRLVAFVSHDLRTAAGRYPRGRRGDG